MHFVALVDSQVWSLAGELDDGVAFLGTQFTGSGSKSFDAREWVTLPQDAHVGWESGGTTSTLAVT